VTWVNRGSTFALRRSTRDSCLGGQCSKGIAHTFITHMIVEQHRTRGQPPQEAHQRLAVAEPAARDRQEVTNPTDYEPRRERDNRLRALRSAWHGERRERDNRLRTPRERREREQVTSPRKERDKGYEPRMRERHQVTRPGERATTGYETFDLERDNRLRALGTSR